MKTLSVKLPESLDKKLSLEARRRRTTKSAVLRGAVERFVGGSGGRARGSCLDLAGDLAGCLEGPTDLSVNKDRLKDFGR